MIHASYQSFGTDPTESWAHYAAESHKVAWQTGVYIYTLSQYEHVDTILSTNIWEKTHSSFNVLLEQESHKIFKTGDTHECSGKSAGPNIYAVWRWGLMSGMLANVGHSCPVGAAGT